MSKSIATFSATTTPDEAVIHHGAELDPDRAALAARRQYLEETLHGITRRLFEVGLTLSTTAGIRKRLRHLPEHTRR